MSNWQILSEFTSKGGTELVICNLKDMVSNIGTIEYLACPLCSTSELTVGYSSKRRNKLSTDGYIGYCYRCNKTFLNIREEVDENEESDLPKFNLNLNQQEENLSSDSIDIFNQFLDINESGMNYIIGRNPRISEQLIKALRIKSINNGVVIPFYDSEQLIFYVIRFINEIGGRRYHMPPINHKPPYILDNLIGLDRSKIIITEGIFSAIACLFLFPSYVPIAILGSKISLFQVNYLKSRFNPEDILIYLDDTLKSEKTKEIIKLNWSGIYDIDVIPSDGTDPEEMLIKLITKNE